MPAEENGEGDKNIVRENEVVRCAEDGLAMKKRGIPEVRFAVLTVCVITYYL